jgi:uncharacterized protein (DUF2126 family)
MSKPDPLKSVAAKVEATFTAHGVQLTLGGEPTFVPVNPEGPEWQITALGPTKLRYAYALTDALIAQALPRAVPFCSPGKAYPGEVNPRWAINLVWNRDDSPLVPALAQPQPIAAPTAGALETFKSTLLRTLRVENVWLRAIDPTATKRPVWVLPLDHDGQHFVSNDWTLGKSIKLLPTDGPAGLRLPLNLVPADLSRRALTIEVMDDQLHVFLPPLLQKPFLALVEKIAGALQTAKIGPAIFAGYVPSDEADRWTKLAIGADPGVLEINLPPCFAWSEYDWWLRTLEKVAESVGLRSFKQVSTEEALGTGGGNHLLFGGPSLDSNPLFTHPRWITSMLRYWQHHPSLAYLFTGQYVGPSSQAPRPDESASALYDLEMAYRFLETLPPGDHRFLLSETIRHLHTDGTGNTHRSEASFDKFWNVNFDGGCRGLVEFRAIESFPHASWMSAIALLWRALAAYLLAHPFMKPLIDHGERLHDYFFLPTCLWADFEAILRDLRKAGFDLPAETYRAIADWRFPKMLSHSAEGATLTIRKGLEGWPLLCETPLEGGNTSRFVDTSIERLEFVANAEFAKSHEIYVQGRRLDLQPFPKKQFGVGLRYRRTSLYPSLHPGIPPQMPLMLLIKRGRTSTLYKLDAFRRTFELAPNDPAPARSKRPCKTLHSGLLTCDLRLP